MYLIRAFWTILLFSLITLGNGLVALVLGGLLSLLCWWRVDHPLGSMPYEWAKQLKTSCADPFRLNWHQHKIEDLRKKNGLKLVICNHPPTILTWAPLYLTGQFVSQRIAMVLKSSHLLNPIGWGLIGLRSGVFVSRLYKIWPLRQWAWLEKKLRLFSKWWYRWQVQRLVKRASKIDGGIAIIIFPDQRFKVDRQAGAVKKYSQNIPDVGDWAVTLPPQAGGLGELLQACGGLDVTVVDMTIIVYARNAEGWTNFEPYLDGAVLFSVQDVTAALRTEAPDEDFSRFGEKPEQLRDWLNERFRQKNTTGKFWRKQLVPSAPVRIH